MSKKQTIENQCYICVNSDCFYYKQASFDELCPDYTGETPKPEETCKTCTKNETNICSICPINNYKYYEAKREIPKPEEKPVECPVCGTEDNHCHSAWCVDHPEVRKEMEDKGMSYGDKIPYNSKPEASERISYLDSLKAYADKRLVKEIQARDARIKELEEALAMMQEEMESFKEALRKKAHENIQKISDGCTRRDEKIIKLKKEMERMKVCGNCKHTGNTYPECHFCSHHDNITESLQVDNWTRREHD